MDSEGDPEDEPSNDDLPVLFSSTISTACVHWYSGDQGMLDDSLQPGQRGWNVESVYGVTDFGARDYALAKAAQAKEHGLNNLIRIDASSGVAVPMNSQDYGHWADNYIARVHEFSGVARHFIVGNEPTIEPGSGTSAAEYADAFNYLYVRRGEMPVGTVLLAAGPAGFSWDQRDNRSFLDWLEDMSNRLEGVDGFALHAYGDPNECWDPRQPCSRNSWPFDGGFLTFREQIDRVAARWGGSKPVYITEFNTDTNGLGNHPDPSQNYREGWINDAFDAVRSYNASRPGNRPEVRSLCWFVDRDDGPWGDFSLRQMSGARDDMAAEFHHGENFPGGSGDSEPAPSAPDARIDQLTWSPAVPAPGDALTFHAQVTNAGSVGTGETVGVAFFVNNSYVGFGVHTPMAAGETQTISLDSGGWQIPGAGQYEVRTMVDDVGRFAESNELNNVKTAALVVSSGEPEPEPEPEPGGCPCVAGVDNFCFYAPSTPGCAMTAPNGYCDPDGNGDFGDADWVEGWYGYAAQCGENQPAPEPEPEPEPGCPCIVDHDNYCQYGPSYPGCEMTEPFGYCDPNGDGEFEDAQWDEGWYDYHEHC